MNSLKRAYIVWWIVAVLLFAFLTTIGFIYKNKTAKYKKEEKNIVEIVKKYTATDFNFPTSGEVKIVTLDELKEKGLIKEVKVNKNKCKGYIEVTFNNVTEYKAYISCGDYKTHGFDSKNLK